MKSLGRDFLEQQAIPIEMGGMIQALGEFKGRQDLFHHQTPPVLESLRQVAIIESTESSNRIEGVTVAPERFKELMLRPRRPKDRSEAEILGYRNILSQIHTTPGRFAIDEMTIRKLHSEIYAQTDIPSGHWKKRDNTVEEKLPNGRWITRFVPVSARNTPSYMEELCKRFNRLWDEGRISPLLLIPAFILDFLCVHPFTDGNGRVSRLLTVLLLHQSGYGVGRYISLERLTEQSKETYYEALRMSSEGWHEDHHRLKPWWEYSLGVLIGAYREFEERVGTVTKARGAKTSFVEQAVDRLPSTFGIGDLERACPSVSRDMIRVVLNRLRKEGKLSCKSTGRKALWEKRGSNTPKRGNKRGND
ncbi:MAG: Fic family protein [Candidatus Eisenbacteria bacterium]|nr:Fic family protein [Candidatus Eisenbacteria bacterium]